MRGVRIATERPVQRMKVLNNGVEMPLVGLGVFLAEDGEETENAVRWALRAGYRHIDTSAAYGNEISVRGGIQISGVRRDEIFVTTKLTSEDMIRHDERSALKKSLTRLGLAYVDLYVLEWPVENACYESWRVVEEMHHAGLIRAIGVSHFSKEQLERLLEHAQVVPAVNQIECNPLMPQHELLAFCEEMGIAVTACSPLCRGGEGLFKNGTVARMANKHGKSPAQIALRWNLQRGVTVLPKSVCKGRIEENAELFDFALSETDMAVLDSIAKGGETLRAAPLVY